ncbi:MAG: arsenite methyltransferase [Cyclobacteriaceae bacterium]|jgi:SAM-dependent methyltransferase|nr:arsenite methyltransferase [Cyclobacteriaceae bacterium]
METAEQLKNLVREKYQAIADQSKSDNETSCCGNGCGLAVVDNALMAEDYSAVAGYLADADLGLGCGLPTQFAHLKAGDTVVDLGSGAGNDAFVARAVVGPSGKVIGVDFTERMIEKAQVNAQKLGYDNVEFRRGDIESLPVASHVADVVVSNCVLNLVPNKHRAFAETFRVLKPGGHFSVSDIVLKGQLPESLRTSAEMYAGCIAGAIQKEEYLRIIREAGFSRIEVQKEKRIAIPDALAQAFLSASEMDDFRRESIGICSITVYAEKPGVDERPSTACTPGCC